MKNIIVALCLLTLLTACGGGGGAGGAAASLSAAGGAAAAAAGGAATGTVAVPCREANFANRYPVPHGPFKISFTGLTATEISEATRAMTDFNNHIGTNIASRDDANGIAIQWNYERYVDLGSRTADGFTIYSDESGNGPVYGAGVQFTCDSDRGNGVWTQAVIRISAATRPYFETNFIGRAAPEGTLFSAAKPFSIYYEFYAIYMRLSGFPENYNYVKTARYFIGITILNPTLDLWQRYNIAWSNINAGHYIGNRNITLSADFNSWYPAP